MDLPALYDEDIYAWSLSQAAVLRRMAAEGRDRLPNDLDVENVAEEIEDVGRSWRAAVESHLVVMLEHVLKAASSPGALPVRKWLHEIGRERLAALRRYSPGMRKDLNPDRLWSDAVSLARLSLAECDEALLPVPDACPFTLDELLDRATSPEDYVARLASPKPDGA